MRALLAALLLAPALALAQGIQARPAAAANPTFSGTVTMPSTGVKMSVGPRIPDDANTVCHIWFNGASIQKSGTCSWTMVGTVPQVAASGNAPAGAGPFSISNYYSEASGVSDPLDLSGANFTVCALYKPGADNSTETIFGAGGANVTGYNVSVGTPFLNVALYGSGVTYTASHSITSNLNGGGAGSVGLYCGGRIGAFSFAQYGFNAHTVTAAASPVAGTTVFSNIGVTAAAASPAAGTLYEIWWTTTAPSKSLVDRIAARVLPTF